MGDELLNKNAILWSCLVLSMRSQRSQAAVIRHSSGRTGSTFEIYVWLVINVSPWFEGEDWLALPVSLALAFISRHLSARFRST